MQFTKIVQSIKSLRDSIEVNHGAGKSEAAVLLDKAMNTVLAAKEYRKVETNQTMGTCIWGTCQRCSNCKEQRGSR